MVLRLQSEDSISRDRRRRFVYGLGENLPKWELHLDPIHNREQTAQCVRVAVGRDYADVPPTCGVFKGNGKEKMAVEISVKAV